jgi:uncharacterized protein YbjT (DUF2867 family)
MSQLQSTPVASSSRNLQHRLADQIFDWADVGAVHLNGPPFFENVRALIAKTVTDQHTIFLPWGDGNAVIPLVAAEDVARVAAALHVAPNVPDRGKRICVPAYRSVGLWAHRRVGIKRKSRSEQSRFLSTLLKLRAILRS